MTYSPSLAPYFKPNPAFPPLVEALKLISIPNSDPWKVPVYLESLSSVSSSYWAKYTGEYSSENIRM